MKTTFDLPSQLLERGKIAAVQRRTSLKSLVIQGLESVLNREVDSADRTAPALERLRAGYQLGGKPLSREASHGRR